MSMLSNLVFADYVQEVLFKAQQTSKSKKGRLKEEDFITCTPLPTHNKNQSNCITTLHTDSSSNYTAFTVQR